MRRVSILWFAGGLLWGLPCAATAARTAASSVSDEAADTVAARFAEAATRFRLQAEAFENSSGKAGREEPRREEVRRRIDALRAAYKGMEFLVEYAQPGLAARLNPPPLERANARSPDAPEVLPPEGLQALQQITISADSVPRASRRESMHDLAERLADAARALEAGASGKGSGSTLLDDRMVFEAMQQQVIRVMTLGITGFEPPARERSLPESRLSLEALRPVVALYLPPLRHRDPAVARRLEGALGRAIQALPSGGKARPSPPPDLRTFDAFDRLRFIREAGDPLYAALIDAQRALGLATFADLAPLRRPVSVTARSLFAPDFLDPHYYSLTAGERGDAAAEQLGRRLFFDPILSADRRRSCASCHAPERAFSDGLPRSPALTGGSLLRNAPGLSFAAYQSDQFWDMREETLEKQVLHVIAGGEEFRSDFMAVMDRLQKDSTYPALFARAFGARKGNREGLPKDPQEFPDEPLQMKTAAKALALYVRTLARWNSPFDRYVRHESESLDPAARRGFNLFMGKAACATCHFPPAFNGTVPPRYLETESEVIGVPEAFPARALRLDGDLGRGMTLASPVYQRAFKTPSLRNVALTAPYMHQGGMATLEEVIDFYDAGGGRGLGLDVPYQTLPADSLRLTGREKRDLVAFLKSLTDTTGYGRQRPPP